MQVNAAPDGFDPTRLAAILDGARDLTVWVIGDLILDEYVTGEASRLSPEAPVPVVRVTRTDHRLGGAANVARQVVTLGARVAIAGVLGQDPAGDEILQMCASSHVDTRAVVRLPDRPSTRKLRVLARQQQLVRLDWEDTVACTEAVGRGMLDQLTTVPTPSVVILSDYAKGLLTTQFIAEVMRLAATHGACVVVDPKRRDFLAYRGANVITPNLQELQVATGMTFAPEDVEAIGTAAGSLIAMTGAQALVVKLGARGMLVVSAEGVAEMIPAWRHAVFDATGAGDTVVALVAASLAAGATIVEAARIANAAASITVGSVGTVSVEAGEIAGVLAARHTHAIFDRTRLAAQVRRWHDEGKRVVFTNGCFDLLHAGHLSLLHSAARYGDVLVVGINSDGSVGRLKGPTRPLIPERERAAMLAALECVDGVTVFSEDTPLELLQVIRPDVLVKGGDYRLDQVVGRELVEAGGGKVVLVPLVPDRSTTGLIERIAAQKSTGD